MIIVKYLREFSQKFEIKQGLYTKSCAFELILIYDGGP